MATDHTAPSAPGTFSLREHYPPGVRQALGRFVGDHLIPFAMGLMRKLNPVLRIPFTQVYFVTGFDAVQEVFARPKDFVSAYEPKCEVLDWRHFILAMPDNKLYWHIESCMKRLWRREDLDGIVAIVSRESRSALAEAEDGRLDFTQDYVARIGMAVIRDYYGIMLPENPKPFFDGVLFGNGFVFGLPKIKAKAARDARAAIAEVWPVIDASIDMQRGSPNPDTVIGRYHLDTEISSALTEEDFRSAIMAMIGGFLPASCNSNGRTLRIFLEQPVVLEEARRAVREGDHEHLLKMLHEAMRLDYIIPMLWRRPPDNTWLGHGTAKAVPVPAQSTIVLSNKVAMRDPKRVPAPMKFRSDRSEYQYLVYGHGFHYCIGAEMNDAILKVLFGELLRHDVRRVDKISWAGLYPWHFPIEVTRAGA